MRYDFCNAINRAFGSHPCLPTRYLRHHKPIPRAARIALVKRIPWNMNTQLTLVGCGYLAVLAFSAFLMVVRYFAYMTHAADAVASGGMWAGGDLILELMIVGMLLGMTFFLVLVIKDSETAYTTYSKVLVGISLTAPLSVALISIPAVSHGDFFLTNVLGFACMFRLFASPLIALGIGASRLFARFPRPKKLTVYALAIEGLTLVAMAAFLFSGHSG
jgi:hypothetical protein